MRKILFVASEAHPLVKTGGLGDVCGSLPPALRNLGLDVRLLLPAYRQAKLRAGTLQVAAELPVPRIDAMATLLEGTLPGTDVPLWLVDFPPAFDRAGDPYLDEHARPWYDNAPRFALLAHVAVALAQHGAPGRWRPDVVHCHDWQTGLVPALLALTERRPATVFTIHNLAYQGLFPPTMFRSLGLPPALWSPEGVEFYGQLSFMKGGLAYADRINTVSPTYAREIQTPALGCGLDGLLRHRVDRLSGILNGIDVETWDPARDPHLAATYTSGDFERKAIDKRALQEMCGLPLKPDAPLLGMVGRLVEQKGVDLVLGAWPALARQGLQLVVLGSGEAEYEDAWRRERAQWPSQLAVKIGYDETLAHRIEAGADFFLMPSRFEPCGLNQLYSLRYGTIPVVRPVGGLADTVIDATDVALADGRATGIVFDGVTPAALQRAVERGVALYRQPQVWRRLALTGMCQDFGWRHSASQYVDLYERALRDRKQPPPG